VRLESAAFVNGFKAGMDFFTSKGTNNSGSQRMTQEVPLPGLLQPISTASP
jgi:hypothetical protein